MPGFVNFLIKIFTRFLSVAGISNLVKEVNPRLPIPLCKQVSDLDQIFRLSSEILEDSKNFFLNPTDIILDIHILIFFRSLSYYNSFFLGFQGVLIQRGVIFIFKFEG